jgi:hypothetical protein
MKTSVVKAWVLMAGALFVVGCKESEVGRYHTVIVDSGVDVLPTIVTTDTKTGRVYYRPVVENMMKVWDPVNGTTSSVLLKRPTEVQKEDK